jgi:hypothetical protein
MSLPRRMEPEWLDQLPADEPRAMRSRRDLMRVNALMRNAHSMATALRRYGTDLKPQTIADLGCGDGRFMLSVARHLAPYWPNVTVILLDRQNIVSSATRDTFAALRWRAETICEDVFSFFSDVHSERVDVVTCNLFLHHFTELQLRHLLAVAAERSSLFVACEPRRAKFVVRISRLLWAVGCNNVSVHDAVVSARAGFTGQELSALWPGGDQWQLHERAAAMFTHRFAARRPAAQREG